MAPASFGGGKEEQPTKPFSREQQNMLLLHLLLLPTIQLLNKLLPLLNKLLPLLNKLLLLLNKLLLLLNKLLLPLL